VFDALGDGVAVGGVLGQDFNLDDFGDEVNVGLAGLQRIAACGQQTATEEHDMSHQQHMKTKETYRREVALHSLSLKHQVKLDQVADRVSVYLYGVSFSAMFGMAIA
jgi:hypothetical protein